jgi:hypothetical protein
MDLVQINRREMLAWMALGGVLLGRPENTWAEKKVDAGPKYPGEKTIRALEKDGWFVEYKKTDAAREGVGLRAPSALAPQSYVCTPAIIEAQFEGQGKFTVVLPRYANVCNQTALVSKVEVEVGDASAKRGRDYTLTSLTTKPLGNRFWQVKMALKDKSKVKIRVIGVVSDAAAPTNWKEDKPKLAELAAQPKTFEKKYKVLPSPHWFKKTSDPLREEVAAAIGDDKQKRWVTLLHILQYVHKKGKLTKTGERDPELFVKEGMKGSCGANADFVNYVANAAGNSYLFFTEGFVAVPRLDYLGLHAWNNACLNGFFIADALNPELYFPEYPEYVATAVGPSIGHPAKPPAATNGGWATGDYVQDYYIYFSLPPYGIHGKKLAKMTLPDGVQQLGDFVAHQRKRVNHR